MTVFDYMNRSCLGMQTVNILANTFFMHTSPKLLETSLNFGDNQRKLSNIDINRDTHVNTVDGTRGCVGALPARSQQTSLYLPAYINFGIGTPLLKIV